MGRRRKARCRTRVFVVQDKSGSMAIRRAETISGYNEYLDNIDVDDVLVTLIQFDTDVDKVYVNTPINDVPDMTADDFVPYGMTALRDGVGEAIKIAESSAGSNDRVLFVVMTDGGENSSRKFSHEEILRKIGDKRRDGWEFIFLGAGEEAWNAGINLGFHADQTLNYSALDAYDHQVAYAAVSGTTMSFLRGGDAVIDKGTKVALESKAKRELAK